MWYSKWFDIFIYIPFMLKVYIPDRNNLLNRNTLIKLYEHLFTIRYYICNSQDATILETINLYPSDNLSWETYLNKSQDSSFKIVSFYNMNDNYIGDIDTAIWLFRNNILNPQPAISKEIINFYLNQRDRICSIGMYKKDGYKGWIGCSHRASCFFRVGDALFDPEATLEECRSLFPELNKIKTIEGVPYNKRGKKTCITMLDCKWAVVILPNI